LASSFLIKAIELAESHPLNLPGSYALILHAVHSTNLLVGKAGRLEVRPGIYIYTGSAFGPGGLYGRLARHLRSPFRLHWHIDYLRRGTVPLEVWVLPGGENHEHAWAKALTGLPRAHLPMLGFGASDCRCPAHLVWFPEPPPPRCLVEKLSNDIPTDTTLQRWLPGKILSIDLT
jgi:Uri superfamily endonuclease